METAMRALAGVRVLEYSELVAGPYCGRMLADLGAEVIKVEPPEGDRARRQRTSRGRIPNPEASPVFVHLNTNKFGITLDLRNPEGQARFKELAETADIVIEDLPPAEFAELGLGYGDLSKLNPSLVLTSITPFGQTGPYRDYRANHLQLFNATEGHTAARSSDGRPTAAGGYIGDYDGGLTAGVATLAAFYQARRTGKGQHVDISRYEAMAALQRIDILIARNEDHVGGLVRGPQIGGLLRCKDGYVVMTVAEDHQWRYLADVMGNPEWSKDPRAFNRTERNQIGSKIQASLVEWAKQHTKHELFEIGQGAKFPIGAVLTAPELLASPQLMARDYFAEADHPVAGLHSQASMAFKLSQSPWKSVRPSPRLGEHNEIVSKPRPRPNLQIVEPATSNTPGRGGVVETERPLSGIRILDFTWAWAGSYATFILGHLGAEIIKIESLKRLDLSRMGSITTGQRFQGFDSSTVFNDLNLNKKCVRLNLSKPEAVAIVHRLAQHGDVVAQNMRPGVFDRLGLGYEALSKTKEDIIMLSSSAAGSTGPHRSYVGYAPVFTALGGLAHVTGSHGGNPVPLYGSVDLRSATTSAFAVIAALHQRATTGEGQHIDLSSVESTASLIGHLFTEYQLTGLTPRRRGNDDPSMAPHNSYPCRDGEWVSITVEDDSEWEAFCRVGAGAEWSNDPRFQTQRGRWRHRRELDALVGRWTNPRSAHEVTELLQGVGVPALPCFGPVELASSPQLEARGAFSLVNHAALGDREVLGVPWKLTGTPDVAPSPAPLLGEHNDYVLHELLGLSTNQVLELEAAEIVY